MQYSTNNIAHVTKGTSYNQNFNVLKVQDNQSKTYKLKEPLFSNSLQQSLHIHLTKSQQI